MSEFNLGLLLNGDDESHPCQLTVGYSPATRAVELVRLGCVVPAGCYGYVTQIERGSRAVRIDAARQLSRAGVEFNCDPSRIEG